MPEAPIDERVQAVLNKMATAGMENAATGLSEMINQRVTVSVPAVSMVSISTVPERVGGAESRVVGIYLACEGEMTGHVMLIMAYEDALQLVDMLLGEPAGKTQELDSLARSALAEVGNVTASFFLNATAATLGIEGRPSPPAVIVDMAGAILDIMLVSAGTLSDEILLLETIFKSEERELKMYFWVVPDLAPFCTAVDENGRRPRQ